MDNNVVRHYTRFFKALSDPTRLGIVLLLARGELCVCQIEAALKAKQTKISRHLAYLRKHGIVRVRTQWKWKHYSLFKPRNKFEKSILNYLQRYLATDRAFKNYFARLQSCLAQPLDQVVRRVRKR